MIESSYAKAILNILMAKPVNSADGKNDPALEERAKLKENGVQMYVAPKTNLTKTESDYKAMINNSTYWKTEDITGETESGDKLTGYRSVRKDSNSSKFYPTKRYLALLTGMPNPDGSGFEEFKIINEITENEITKEEEIIYCKRINLNTGYFSADLIMKPAEKNTGKIDPEDPDSDIVGGAMTQNEVVIYFPEITEKDWEGADSNGPALLGFGIFENDEEPNEEQSNSEEKPYLWGALSNDAAAKLAHVPLFRKDKFQFFIK